LPPGLFKLGDEFSRNRVEADNKDYRDGRGGSLSRNRSRRTACENDVDASVSKVRGKRG
jgi:hypothetical protein